MFSFSFQPSKEKSFGVPGIEVSIKLFNSEIKPLVEVSQYISILDLVGSVS